MPARNVARRIGVLPQDESAGFDFTAEQAVALLAASFGVDGSLLPDPVTARPRLLLRPLRS